MTKTSWCMVHPQVLGVNAIRHSRVEEVYVADDTFPFTFLLENSQLLIDLLYQPGRPLTIT